MPDLNFEVLDATAPPFAAAPLIAFKLRITNAVEQELIYSVSLRCQIQIAATRRRYSPEAQAKLLEVFGEPHRWGETLRSFLWTHANAVVPEFSGSIDADLLVPCTYDFEIMSTKYFNALEDGSIPLTFLFSGTMFYQGEHDNLQVGQISWSKEASYRLPVTVWKAMIERYFPNSAWILLQKDIFDQLHRYKATHSLPTWEETVLHLLQASGQEVQR